MKTPSDADLLSELATVDEVAAWIPTANEHQTGITPPWCELVLEVRRTDDGTLTPAWPINARLPLRRHDGELIIQTIHDALHPHAGGEVLETLWLELDDVVNKIQRRVEKGKTPKLRDQGLALGLATAIAILANPFAYDVDQVRAEAMERYEARNAE